MNGVHDMGGMDGFGKVEAEPNEPVFHEPWEGRVMAMNRAMGASGAYNIDIGRYYREMLRPDVYLASSYYKKWALAMEQSLLDRGYVEPDELAEGRALHPPKPLKRGAFTMETVKRVMTRSPFGREPQAAARFKIGARVRAKNIHPATHTRLPRYVRGHVGVIERLHGAHVFPDSAAIDAGENPQWLYTVCFDSTELWGPDADATVKVSIEAFEPYLDPA